MATEIDSTEEQLLSVVELDRDGKTKEGRHYQSCKGGIRMGTNQPGGDAGSVGRLFIPTPLIAEMEAAVGRLNRDQLPSRDRHKAKRERKKEEPTKKGIRQRNAVEVEGCESSVALVVVG
jgi:hypothetical protein